MHARLSRIVLALGAVAMFCISTVSADAQTRYHRHHRPHHHHHHHHRR